jgi:hypothetical protein
MSFFLLLFSMFQFLGLFLTNLDERERERERERKGRKEGKEELWLLSLGFLISGS